MEEAIKPITYVRPGVGRKPDHEAPDPVEKKIPAGERKQDRWFVEERSGRKVPKRLDIANEALVQGRGPLKLKGNITLIDETGEESFHNEITLCRCGASNSKPICDEGHIDIEFIDNAAINQASDTIETRTPQPLTVTVVKDGPLKFRGYLKVHNLRGQSCISRQGALCRCGKSAKKPFCDCI